MDLAHTLYGLWLCHKTVLCIADRPLASDCFCYWNSLTHWWLHLGNRTQEASAKGSRIKMLIHISVTQQHKCEMGILFLICQRSVWLDKLVHQKRCNRILRTQRLHNSLGCGVKDVLGSVPRGAYLRNFVCCWGCRGFPERYWTYGAL